MEERKERKEGITLEETEPKKAEEQLNCQKEGLSKLSIILIAAISATVILIGIIFCVVTIKNNGSEDKNPVEEQVIVEETAEVASQPEVKQEEADTKQSTVAESTTEASAVEESAPKEQQENLSNKEWRKSLNLDAFTFLVFNDTTGERKVLEEGQEYQIVEGDELAYWYPAEWTWIGQKTSVSYDLDAKYGCVIFYVQDSSLQNAEFTQMVLDTEGKEHSATIYLSK